MRCWLSYTRNAEVSCTCYKHTSTTTIDVDDTTYSSASAPSMDMDHSGGCTQILGGKAFEPKTSQPQVHYHHHHLISRMIQCTIPFSCTYPTCICAPLGVIAEFFVQIFRVLKLDSLDYRAALS